MTAKTIIESHFSNTATVWRDRIYKAKKNQRFWEYFDKQYRFDYVVGMISSLPRRGGRALDIGCGAGQLIPLLAEMGYEVVANDISDNMVQLARRSCSDAGIKADVHVGDCEDMKYPDNHFDLVVAMGVIEYMDDDQKMLKEVHRVLKPGGTAIITFRNVRCVYTRWRTFYLPIEMKYLRPLFGKSRIDYQRISRRHDPRDVRKTVQALSFKTVQDQYCHYHTLPAPLEKFRPWSWLQAILGKSMEKVFKRTPIPWMASTYILRFEKA